MEIKYEDWDRILKQVEQGIKSDTMTGMINKHVLEFVTEQRNKHAKPKLPRRSEVGKGDTDSPKEIPKS